jgi:antitoxin component YwqK of YwqJK toxin-antitoxin module
MKKKLFLFINICLLLNQINYAQKELIGFDGVTDVSKIVYNGDSVIAIYQPDNIINVDRNRYPEYYRGLPDSLPNLPDGKYVLFNSPHDSVGVYLRETWYIKNNKRDSFWTKYDDGKIISEKHYKEGKLTGKQREWDNSGKIKAEWNVKNDSLNGEAFYYDEDEGRYSYGIFENGAKMGKWTYFYDSLSMSNTYTLQFYNMDKRFGFIEKVYRNDSLVEETYSNNKGYKKYKNGVLLESRTYKQIERKTRKYKNTKAKKEKDENILINGIKFDETLNYLDTSSYKALLKIIKKFKNSNEVLKVSFYTANDIKDVNPPWIRNVVDFLIDNGINAFRIIPVSYSNAKPLISEEDLNKIKNLKRRNKYKSMNQRIEYKIIKK